MKFLVDTNVVSEIRKGPRCHESVARWVENTAQSDLFISVITIGEIRRGVERIRRRDSRSADILEAWLFELVAEYEDRIVPIDLEIATEWGRLNVPDPLPVVDGLLAATARVRNLVVATRNVRDIARAGVDTVNPWLP